MVIKLHHGYNTIMSLLHLYVNIMPLITYYYYILQLIWLSNIIIIEGRNFTQIMIYYFY